MDIIFRGIVKYNGHTRFNGDVIHGSLAVKIVDGVEKYFIQEVNEVSTKTYTINYTKLNEFEIFKDSIKQYTNLIDMNCNMIYDGDDVRLINGQIGRICFESGSFGLVILDGINYKTLQDEMYKMGINNEFKGCFNDNFISLWELYWNFECEEGVLYCLELIK